ncbi:nucleotidyltransferase family protein [Campylobacter sp.]|uniref:nucleotidyltransferase family protein n=1 Tax=Campylobacter sp. TaxID=205 RepID=UPI0026FB8018|nr:nucleotidyltransferase domain-containing protein [Campylobacter sp.]
MPTKEEILEFLRSLKPELESFGIKKVGLFGSYAKDKANIASDIDVVIESSEETIQKAGGGIKAIIYLEELRSRIMKRFKISADLCDIASMSEEKKQRLLQGVIYV